MALINAAVTFAILIFVGFDKILIISAGKINAARVNVFISVISVNEILMSLSLKGEGFMGEVYTPPL